VQHLEDTHDYVEFMQKDRIHEKRCQPPLSEMAWSN